MVSIWWLVATFFAGGCAGMLLFALMQIPGVQLGLARLTFGSFRVLRWVVGF